MPPILACICYCWRKFIFIDYNEFWPVFARGGKTQNFGFMFGLGSLMIRVRFCSGCIIIIIIINVLIKVTLNEIRCRGTVQSQW